MPGRQRDGSAAEVGDAPPAARAGEVQHLAAGAGHPLHGLRGLQAAAPAQGVAVEPQGRGGIAFLRLHAERAKPRRLGQVGGAGPEPERGADGGPGQWDTAAVAALLRAARPAEDRILDLVPGNVGDLVQAEFLALVQVRRAGRASISRIAGRARRRPRPRSSLGEVPPFSSQARAAWCPRSSGGSPYRVACRTTSSFESTHVLDDPCRCASERLSVTTRRNSPAFQLASSRSKLKACPARPGWRTSAAGTGAPRPRPRRPGAGRTR